MLDVRDQEQLSAATAAASAEQRSHRSLVDAVSGWEAAGLAVYWLVSTTWLTAVAPAPDPVQPALIVALNVVFNLGFFAALAGAAMRRRFALLGSAVAGAAMAIMATFCGLEGHSGLWIPAQFAVGAGILAYGAHRLRT